MAQIADNETDMDALQERYCRDRDTETRNVLVNHYTYIAEILAKKFLFRGVEYDDLLQVASLALIKALDRFECGKGYKFSSFATPTIVGEIKNYFRDHTRMIRIPRRDSEMIKQLDVAANQLGAKLGRTPSAEEVATETGLPLERVLELMEEKTASYTLSLDKSIDDDEETELSALLGTEEKEYAALEDMEFLKKSLGSMGTMEKRLLQLRFAESMSQREVAKILGVSQMYISRMEKKILERLRSNLAKP